MQHHLLRSLRDTIFGTSKGELAALLALFGCAPACTGSDVVSSTESVGGALAIGGTSSTTGGNSGASVEGSGGAASSGGATAFAPSGGHSTTGGALTVGGNSTAGGTLGGRAAGGTSATVSSEPSGGIATAGGSSATGGAATGGDPPTGGNRATGGVPATGGTGVTGGASAAGGSRATGGLSTTAGSKPTGGTSGTGGSAQKCSVYIAGDSTVSTYTLTSSAKDQAGWGQMLQQYYASSAVTVVNKAVGGMTARHFIQAGNLDAILAALKAGDYFLVQFGTNDSNTTATYTINGVSYPYYAAADTDFKTYLQQYIDGANAKKATAVLVTPPPRNSAYCGGGRSMANYAQAMIDLGKADNVAVVDLSMKTWSYLNVICPKPTTGSTENFFKVNADDTIDGTHFQENGATIMARFVADGIGEAQLPLNGSRLK